MGLISYIPQSKHVGLADWVHYRIELQPTVQFIQTTRGRPSAQSTYKRVVRTITR